MQTITVYDSEGNEYGTQRTGRADQRIKDFFFAGLKLAVDLSGSPEVVCFFRARESDTGRSEQFYAVYETESKRNLFSNFKNDLERTIDQYGLTLVTDTDDTQFHHELDQEGASPPGDDMQRTVIAEGGGQGQSMRVGVGSTKDAFSLAKSYLSDRKINSIAIADQTTGSVFDNYDLSIEIGQYRGIETLGETESYLDEVRGSIEGQLVTDRIDKIKEEVQTLRSKTSLSGGEIQTRLKQDLSVLDPPAYEMATNNSSSTGSGRWKTQLGAIAGVLILLVAVVGGAGLYFGYLPFGDGGDDNGSGPSDSINYVMINGSDETNGDEVEVDVATVDTVPVEINYTADSITVSLNSDELPNESSGDSEYLTRIPVSDLEQGNNTLTVEAGNATEEFTIVNTTSDSGNETEPVSLTVNTPAENTSIQNSSFNVSGTTNAENLTVAFRNTTTGNISTNSTRDIQVGDNTSFNLGYTITENISPGNYSIIINATRGTEFNETTIRNVTVNPQNGTTEGTTNPQSTLPRIVSPEVRVSS